MKRGRTLTKAGLVNTLYSGFDKNRDEVKGIVETLLRVMKKALRKDHAVLLSGFGKFEVYEKAPRRGRNPKTGETITLPGHKVMVFRVSKKYREQLQVTGKDAQGEG